MRRTPLRRVSKKREAEGREYEYVVQGVMVRDHFACQATARGAPGRCFGRIDPHHVHPVGEGGARLDRENLVAICRAHHDWCHVGNRKAAAKLGLITRSPNQRRKP